MATASYVSSQDVIRESFHSIKQIEKVIVDSNSDSISILIVMSQPDSAAEKRVFQKQLEIIDASPRLHFDFDIVYRCGRELADIVSPAGKVLFAR